MLRFTLSLTPCLIQPSYPVSRYKSSLHFTSSNQQVEAPNMLNHPRTGLPAIRTVLHGIHATRRPLLYFVETAVDVFYKPIFARKGYGINDLQVSADQHLLAENEKIIEENQALQLRQSRMEKYIKLRTKSCYSNLWKPRGQDFQRGDRCNVLSQVLIFPSYIAFPFSQPQLPPPIYN